MKIVIAPDSFKGTFSASVASEIMERGVKKIFPEAAIVKVPMADGGEGTVGALVDATGGTIIKMSATGPLGKQTDAFYGILGDSETAVIETAAASGLMLIPPQERNPMVTTTYGSGELIKDALNRGCRRFIIGLGGSATNDGGAGLAAALGVRFLDKDGSPIGFGGSSLEELDRIDCTGLDDRITHSLVLVACDVSNPLCGKEGASEVFGPQKGATREMVEILDRCLRHFALIVKRDVGIDILNIPGAGAAGGIGGGLMAFLGAKLEKGVDIVAMAAELDKKIRDADLVLTGEGTIDYQTTFGKAPYGVARIAKKYNKPIIAIAGNIGQGGKELYDKCFDCIIPTVEGAATLDEAIHNGEPLLEYAAERVMRAVRIGYDMHN